MESELHVGIDWATREPNGLLHILLLDDNADDAALIVHALRRDEIEFTWTQVDNRHAFLDCLTPEVDLVLADYALPGFTGLEALELTHARYPNLPFLLVSGTIGEELAVETIRKGASDYVLKDRMARLGTAVLRALEKRRIDAALNKAREHYQVLIDAVPQIVWTADRNGKVNYINTQWNAYTGCTLEQTEQRGWAAFVPSEDHLQAHLACQRALRSEEPFHVEFRLRRRDGVYRWFLGRGVPGRDTRGNLNRWSGTLTDIDDQKRAEQNQRFLVELGAKIRSVSDPEALVRHVTEAIGSYIDVPRCLFAKVDRRQAQLTICSELHAETPPTARVYPLTALGDEVVRSLQSGETLFVEDASVDARTVNQYEQGYRLIGLRAALAVPLHKNGEWVAVLCAATPSEPRIWTSEEAALLEAVVDQLWLALENIRLHMEAQEEIAERKRAEQELRELALHLEIERMRLMEAQTVAKVGSWELDLRTNMLTCSDEMYRIFGVDGAEVAGVYEAFLECIHPEDRQDVFGAYRSAVANEGSFALDHRLKRKDGTLLFIHERCQTYFENGQPLRLVGTTQDITPLKEAEAALRTANEELEMRVARRTAQVETSNAELRLAKQEAERANRAKSEYLSRMSHELRTPLNAILGFGQILDRQNLTGIEKESIHYILRGGRYLLSLINEVLDIARVEAGNMDFSLEPVAVSDVVAQACDLVRPLALPQDIRLDANLTTMDGIHVQADRQRLHQALINLLANAIKYNRYGGQVDVSCRTEPDGRIRIAVRDTGRGISPEDLPRLFTPFERLGPANPDIEGTGLGLALSQRLIAAMGGALSVESSLGEGSVFTIELPAPHTADKMDADIKAGREDPITTRLSQGCYTILSIEDNLSNLRLMEVILAGHPDIHLVAAMQGSMGLDLAREHTPDLILLDLHLPDMAGKEVLARLQQSEITARIPVIVISADATPAQIERLLAAGARAYLTKPLDVEEFLRTTEAALSERRQLVQT